MGHSYPAIKTGYEWFGIAAQDVPTKLVFAGWRFLWAGLALLALALATRRQVWGLGVGAARQLVVLGLAQTTLQYVFFYVGLAYTTGVKGSIMNATGTFFSVLLAHWIYHNDRLSHAKIWGCVVGFAGVMLVNLGRGTLDLDFTLLGEGFVVIAAFVLAAASIYGKQVSQRMDSMVMTGWQLALGGAALLAIGWGLGGSLTGFTWQSTLLLVYLALLSSAAFSLWSLLLKHNRVSQVTVFNFSVPVFGGAVGHLPGRGAAGVEEPARPGAGVRRHLAGHARCPGPQGIRPLCHASQIEERRTKRPWRRCFALSYCLYCLRRNA